MEKLYHPSLDLSQQMTDLLGKQQGTPNVDSLNMEFALIGEEKASEVTLWF